ncbi:hypothetical protein [Nostoc sp. FACHB-133]|uniref:hypothetical protein n=1 Tax=Nostoc sp. FACHB-133 TaxID=2692835 RepID=UPI00168951C7|nr:hypothetical protein [Nostoc sp. FACHB-133]MBD2525248.1 hypothetical protein [Nostoc sp. FACHB-133]
MLKYSRYFLGVTLFCISTVTVVYASLPIELSQNKADVVYRINGEVDLNKKSEELVLGYKIKDSSDIASAQAEFVEKGAMGLRYVWNALFDVKAASRITANQLADFPTYRYMKQAEGWREPLVSVANNVSPNNITPSVFNQKAPNNFAIIPVSYATSAQSQQKQEIDRNMLNLYIDIRTKLTYLETLFDTVEAIKKSGTSINWDQIQKESSNQLQKNIDKFSESGELEKAFIRNIPEPKYLADHEKQYVDFAIVQIKQAGKIKGLETNVTRAMMNEIAMNKTTNKPGWAKQIALQVHDELKRQSVPALW